MPEIAEREAVARSVWWSHLLRVLFSESFVSCAAFGVPVDSGRGRRPSGR